MDNSCLHKLVKFCNHPKYLYLDQNAWIDLAKIFYGTEIDNDLFRILTKIRNLVDNKKLIVPINITNVLEARKIKDKERREKLARFFILLSKGYSFIPYVYVEIMEMVNLMREKLNLPLIDIRKQAIGKGFLFVCSDGRLPLQYRKFIDSLHLSNDKRSSSLIELERKFNTEDYILNYIIAEGHYGSFNSDSTIEMLKAVREDEFSRFKDKDFRNRYRFARSLLEVVVPKLAQVCYEFKINPRELYPKNPSQNQLMDFFKKLPSIYTGICLNNELMKNKDYSISRNDLYDNNSFTFAIPYCDIVVGEKHCMSVAKLKKLDLLYNTILIKTGELKNIEPHIDKIKT